MGKNKFAKKAILVDTNIAMHYLRLDQIDWISLTDAQNVELVICAVFLAELDKHKAEHQTKKLRKRAGDYAVWLAHAFDQPLIRRGVTLRFLPKEPMLDFKAHGLDPHILDDRLVAAAIELSSAEPELAVSVMTADLGLSLKLRSSGSAVLKAPESARLPDDPTDEELEIRELRKQLATYANRHPKPIVTFADGSSILLVEQQSLIDEVDFVSSRMKTAREKFPYIGATEMPNLGSHPLATQIGSTLHNLTTNYDRTYNMDVDRYLGEYRIYLQDYYNYACRNAAIKKIELHISNIDGTAPASKVDVFVTCNGQAVLSDSPNVGDQPSAPKHPRKRDMFSSASIDTSLFTPPRIRTFDDVLRDRDPTRDRLTLDSSKACFYVHQVKHRQSEEMLPVWLDFGELEKLCSTTLTYEIHADEITNPIRGSLHIRFSDK
jgi:hypothetical protein